MKKSILGILALAGCVSVVSCSDKKEIQEDMNVAKQQSLIERSIVDFTNMVPATDFEELRGFLFQVAGVAHSIDMSGLFLKDSLSSATQFVGDTIYSDTIPPFSYKDEGYDCVIESEFVMFAETSLMLSNFTGHYTATDTLTWAYTEANDLQFIFKDTLGNDCVLKLARQGKEVKLCSPNNYTYFDGKDYDREVEDDTVYYLRAYMSNIYEVSIPEKVVVSLSRNNKDVVSATIATKLSGLSDGYFNIGTSNMGVDITFAANNGYKLTLNANYEANKVVSAGLSMNKSKANVFSLNLSANPEGIPSYELSGDFDAFDFKDSINRSVEDLNAKNIYLSGSLMNEVKFVGGFSDIKKFMELSDSVQKVVNSEIKTKAIVDELNKTFNFYLCFEGSDKKQAQLVFEPLCNVTFNGVYYEEKWSYDPVIALADGSKTSVKEFFNSEQYQVAAVALRRMMKQYMRMIMTGDAMGKNSGVLKASAVKVK